MGNNTIGRAVALVAALISTACALGILLEEVVLGSATFGLKHALTIGIVSLAIFAGHLVVEAWRARHIFGVIGFAVVFLAATGLVVYKSTGRQAEHTFASQAEADLASEKRAAIKGALARSEAMLADAQRDLARECKSGRGKRCQGIEATMSVYEAAIKGHRADLDRLGPPKPIAPEAENFAALTAVFGADRAKVKAASLLVVPFLQTALFEFGAIVGFAFAFRHRPAQQTVQTVRTDRPEGGATVRIKRPAPKAPESPATRPAGRTDDLGGRVLAFINTERALGRSIPSQTHLLQQFPGLKRSTLSDWMGDWEESGAIPKRMKLGRCKVIAATEKRSAMA